MNPFSKLTIGRKVMKNRYKHFMLFAKNRSSPWQLFSVIFIPSGSERKDFFNTDWFILFIPMQWTHFQSWQLGKQLWIVVTSFFYLRKIVRRHDNFSASYSFHPAQKGKIFQHRLIYFTHTNAMDPFSKLTIGETVMKSRYKLLILFARNHVWNAPDQWHNWRVARVRTAPLPS